MTYICPKCSRKCSVLYSVPGQDISKKSVIELIDIDYMCDKCHNKENKKDPN